MGKFKIKEFDTVILKTGEKADITTILSSEVYAADIKIGPKDWEPTLIDDDDIERVISND